MTEEHLVFDLGVRKKLENRFNQKNWKTINWKNRISKKNRLNRLKYLEKCPVRFGFWFWCAWTSQPEPNQFGLGMKKKLNQAVLAAGRLLPLLSLSTTLASRPFICFLFPFTQPPPPLQPFQSSFTLHTSQTQPPPPITPTPINSRPLPLIAASSSPVNELRLFSGNHSSNLERNRRVCEVVKLLPLPDLLQSIASIKAD